jgi:multisubunit Na+/H+ antiporter MnhB subunit
MKGICAGIVTVAGTILVTGAYYVLANEPKGEGPPDYSGISSIYYILIGLILAYGVYDSFFKKS